MKGNRLDMLSQNMKLKLLTAATLLFSAQRVLAQAAGGAGKPEPAKAEAPGDRTIPVRTGTGTLNKTGKAGELKAGGGTGVLKRGKGSLDPSYDPADATKKLGNKDDEAPPPRNSSGGGADKALPSVLTSGADASDKKLPEDIIKFTANFGADIRCKKIPASARVTLDFQDAPIEAVTKLLSCWTNRNIMIDTQKKGGKITILSPQPVSVYEAYRAFLSALAANGLTMTQKGSFYHIVDNTEARASGANVLGTKSSVPSDDNIVTRLIKLKNIDAKDVEQLAGKFKSKAGDVFVYPPNNTLIITDTGTNIQRIMKLLADVDLPLGAEKIWIRPVQHMDAGELVEKVTAIFDAGGKGSPAPTAGKDGAPPGAVPSTANKVVLSKVIADDRSNQIIIIATRANYLKADALIRKLDVPIPGEGGMHIYHLENADAEDVSQALSGLTGGGGGGGSKKPAGGGGAAPKSGGASKGPSGPASLFEGDVKITAYKQSNSLIIESSLKDYLSLQKIIGELDRRRKQVYVEAVIMEISTSKNRKTQLAGSAGTTFDIVRAAAFWSGRPRHERRQPAAVEPGRLCRGLAGTATEREHRQHRHELGFLGGDAVDPGVRLPDSGDPGKLGRQRAVDAVDPDAQQRGRGDHRRPQSAVPLAVDGRHGRPREHDGRHGRLGRHGRRRAGRHGRHGRPQQHDGRHGRRHGAVPGRRFDAQDHAADQ